MLLIIAIGFIEAQAQEQEVKWELNGYVKDLRTLFFVDGADSVLTDNLLHNRLNFQWYANEHLTARVELRNREYFMGN